MFDEKEKESLEKEILSNKKHSKEDEVKIHTLNKKKNFNNRFNFLRVKYKKDPKKFIVLTAGFFVMLSAVIGSSYAYLTATSETTSSVTINAGTLALTFQNEENIIYLDEAIPMTDEDGLTQEGEYTFDVKNTGSIPATYVITLDNTCEVSEDVDLCISNDYIKIGLKEGTNDYKVIKKEGDSFILDTAVLDKNSSKSYKMKLWLDYDTPNDYNAKDGKKVEFRAKLDLSYKQEVYDQTYYAFGEPTKDGTTDYKTLNKNLFISLKGIQKSVCIVKNNTLECFSNKDFSKEKVHMQTVFSEDICNNQSSYVECNDDNFSCLVGGNDTVKCSVVTTNESCEINTDSTVTCS